MLLRSARTNAQTAAREAWYRSLWERRQELTAALLARVPELVDPSEG